MTTATSVHVRVLGPLCIEVDGRPLPMPGQLKHRLISRLALHPGRPVSADALIDALWGDHPPRTARQSLHVHISHIRDRLRPVGADRLVSTTADGAYALSTEQVSLDSSMFENLVEQGMTARVARNLRSARDRLHDAITMWGEPFESLADDYGAMAQRQRLTAVYERGLDAYTETLIDLDDTDRAVELLRTAVATAPLREHPYSQLMRVYLARGEHALAVEVFDRAAAVFGGQLGIDPSDALRSLRDTARTTRRTSDPAPQGSTPSVEMASPSTLLWDATTHVDLSQSGLFTIAADSDTASFVQAVQASAALHGRNVAHGRVVQGAASPLSPLFELAGLDAEAGTSRSPQLQGKLFDQISFQLVRHYFLTPVLILEGLEHAGNTLLDYLMHVLARPGPAPLTVLLLTADPDPDLPTKLSNAVHQRGSLNLPAARTIEIGHAVSDADESLVLKTLSCAGLPASTELIARSCRLGAAGFAAAVDRLAARRIVTVDDDGRLGLYEIERTRTELDLDSDDRATIHVALADAITESMHPADPRRAVVRTHHLLHALPTSQWDDIIPELHTSLHYLESLGAYEDMVALCAPAGDRSHWPRGADELRLLIALGRAEMRTGRTEAGRYTLEQCLELARQQDDGVAFGEALRALLEERSPQTLQASSRALIHEALALLPDEPSETRVQLLTDMANSWYFSDPEQSQRWADDALILARQGAPSTLARALTGAIQAKLRPDTALERLDLALEAQHWARRADSTETLVLALTYEVNALMDLGELRRAEAPLRYASALSEEVQVPRFRWWAATWTALLDFARGDLDQAETGFMSAYELWPTSSSFDPFECLASQLAALRFVQGRGAELIPILDDLTGPDARLEYLAPAALAFAQAGDVDRANKILDRMLAPDALPARHDTVRAFGLALGVETAFMIEAKQHAVQLAEMIAPLREIFVTLNVWGGGGFYWGSLRHGYGLALALAGERVEARRELEQAAREQDATGTALFADRSRAVLQSIDL